MFLKCERDTVVNQLKQWATFGRQWFLYDAKWQCPFRSAELVNIYLQGKHKPIYHPLSDIGDHVVVINTKKIAMEGDYWRTFMYYNHTGYSKGFSATRAYKIHDTDPTAVFRKAVYSSMKGTLIRRHIMPRLHLFPDENIPENIHKNISSQIRQVMPVPKRLDEYTPEEREKFPRLFQFPDDYINHELPARQRKKKQQEES